MCTCQRTCCCAVRGSYRHGCDQAGHRLVLRWRTCQNGEVLYATHVEVDLTAIADNVRAARQLSPGKQVLVAVKADAYGHGAVPVSRHLEAEGLADWFGVATTTEGIELREGGISSPILRLSHAFNNELDAAMDARLVLPVVDTDTVDAAVAAARRLGLERYPVQLAIDTGMRRIGCQPADAVLLARYIQDNGLELQGVFTHLPISDSPAGHVFTTDQLVRFLAAVEHIQQARAQDGLGPVPLIHAANSGAVLGYPKDGFTMVRPGIMAYGYYPDAQQTPRTVPLRQAVQWKSRISAVKAVSAGQSVGYGRTWRAPEDYWVGTVPIGYADGYSRLNSNRGRMLVGGRSVPIAGRVCMDQTMIALGPYSTSAQAPAAVGDEVVVCGSQGAETIPTDELAELMGTISYEVTCLIGKRVGRVYLR